MLDNALRKEKEQRWAVSLQKGNQEALGQLYDAYAPVLLGLISKIVRDKEIAEAVLADTFLTIWMQRKTYDENKHGLLTWMIMLARDTAIKALQAGKFDQFPNKAEITTFASPGQNAENTSENTLAASSDFEGPEAICGLAPTEKAALDLIYLKGYNCAEAAAALNIPLKTLVTSLKKAIKQIGATAAS